MRASERRSPRSATAIVMAVALLLAMFPATAGLAAHEGFDEVCDGATESSFDDRGTTHAGAIDCLNSYEDEDGDPIIRGVDDSTFDTGAATTRQAMAGLLWRWLLTADPSLIDEVDLDAPMPFDDVNSDVHGPAILALSQLGVLQGVTEDRFEPGEAVTRAQAAGMLYRAIVGLDVELEAHVDPPAFEDLRDTFAEHIMALATAGIIEGKTSMEFGYADEVTRGQIASLLARAAQTLLDADRWEGQIGEDDTPSPTPAPDPQPTNVIINGNGDTFATVRQADLAADGGDAGSLEWTLHGEVSHDDVHDGLIETTGVTLSGDGVATIRGSATRLVDIDAESVTIEGLVIEGNRDGAKTVRDGIRVRGNDATIQDVEVRQILDHHPDAAYSLAHGIAVEQVVGVTITGSTFADIGSTEEGTGEGRGHGIRIGFRAATGSSVDLQVSGAVTITDNTFIDIHPETGGTLAAGGAGFAINVSNYDDATEAAVIQGNGFSSAGADTIAVNVTENIGDPAPGPIDVTVASGDGASGEDAVGAVIWRPFPTAGTDEIQTEHWLLCSSEEGIGMFVSEERAATVAGQSVEFARVSGPATYDWDTFDLAEDCPTPT